MKLKISSVPARKIISITFLMQLWCAGIAQHMVTGKVTDQKGEALANANLLLLNSKDSSLVKGTVSLKTGSFNLESLNPGNYLLLCSFIGFETIYLPAFSIGQQAGAVNIGTIRLPLATSHDNNATITAKKPLFEQKIDRMVVNVKNSITSAGNTVLDVLQKSPGVIVNKQAGTINMNGKDGVMVMINGKISYMPADAIIQMLNGMNASNVERIELITTPPARYDASGNAGYINIVLVNNPDAGFNGSASFSAGAFVGSTAAANINCNYRNSKVNVYASYSFLREQNIVTREIAGYRLVSDNGKITETSTNSDRKPIQLNHNIRVGLDYQLSRKTTLGFLVSGYDNKWTMAAINNTRMTINNSLDTLIDINNNEVNHWKNRMGNLNLQHNISTTEELSVNADYLYYSDDNPNNYQNRYYNQAQFLLRNESTRSTKRTIIRILPTQVDYKKKFGEKLDMEAGAKAVFSHFTNDVGVARLVQNNWKPDSSLTANYTLQENIGALYVSASIVAGARNSVKAGLRYEYTSSNLGSETRQNIVDRTYGNIFPTVFYSHKFNDSNSINLSYNRRINRPAFTDLAPFTIFLDPYTFITGNAALQPSILDAINLSYIFKKIVFTTGYSYEAHSIGQFQSEIDVANNKEYITAKNLTSTQTINLSVSIPWTISKWWISQININSNWQEVKADYKQRALTLRNFNYNLSGSENFLLPKSFAFELSGFFQSKGLFGTVVSKAFGQLNAGIQKKWNTNTLRFGVDDIFSSMLFKSSFEVPGQNFSTNGLFRIGQRLFKLTYSFNFGNKSLKAKRERGTASEEERLRIK